jgi:eukaryotic-like serine/threonine-protein kinase
MAFAPGTRLGPYEILAPLGAGGMGEVYRARDTKLGRDVALKVLPTELAEEPERRARLLREARAAASLNHSNICTIYEVGEAGDRSYIAMEVIEGRPLSARLTEGPQPVDDVLRYGRQLADAIAHAHDRDVVHRDLKTANVMVLPDGRVKVLDFGLAKRASPHAVAEVTTRQSLTQGGAILGTLFYMSPEQLRGQPADARSDIWSLGVVLYEMAAGARPFQGQTGFEVSSAILHDAPPALPSRMPPALQLVTNRCLEKEPARRYQRGGEVHAALEALGSGTNVVATPPRVRLKSRRLVVGAATVVAALVVAGAAIWLGVPPIRQRFAPNSSVRIRSIAVLPLENLSRDPEQEYFAAGMHEALITDLSRIGLEKVIAKASADAFKGTTKPLAEVGRALGVEALMTGSVMRANNRIQVTVQLVSAGTGAVLWANRYERSAGDVLSLQNELVGAIAHEVSATITPEQTARLAAAPRVNPAAHDAYLKARSLWASFTNSADTKYLDAAIAQFTRAIQIDPAYAPSHAGLSWLYQTASQGSWRPAKDTFPKARVAALKAVELDEQLASAHAALAGVFLWFDWNWAGAEREIRRALQLNPDSVEALTASEIYLTLVSGRADEAARTSQRILDVDPLNPFSRVQPIWVSFFSRRYDESIAKAKTLVELSPNNLMGPWFLAGNYAAKQMGPEVVRECARVMDLLGGVFVMQPIGACAANLGTVGRTIEARRLLQRLEHPPAGIWLDPVPMGAAYAGVGDTNRAAEWYQRGLEERSPNMIYMKVDPAADPVRSDPRFQALLREMNFPQ